MNVAHAIFFISSTRSIHQPLRHQGPQGAFELRAEEAEVADAMGADVGWRDAAIFDGGVCI
jgi:hypothetical protein